ncbi:alpha/beta fold hydrolase [Undibacterium sp. RuRC25W]|uniref:alpha/beta fold hydrolase n=1 Tax=Undibacterium sp. RuRC25W TaxID=3413047 RepID=UPI003BF095CE
MSTTPAPFSFQKKILLAIAFTLAAVGGMALISLALTWAPDKSVDELKQQWASPPSQFVDVKGLMVHVRDEGWHEDPVPVLLIHGTSSSLHTWEAWAKELKKQHRVITMDLPGFGLTGPNQTNDYSIATYTQFIQDLMDTLHVERAVIGGNSLGGEIAWETAVAAPNRVERLILIDAAGYPFTPLSVPLGFKLAKMPAMSWLMTHCLPHSMVEESVKNVYGNPEKVTAALVDRYEAMTLRAGNRQALGIRMKQLNSGGDDNLIKRIQMPTLILWGGKDKLIPPENATLFHQDIVGSKLIMFDELGHVPQEENPVVTLAAVNIFLQ